MKKDNKKRIVLYAIVAVVLIAVLYYINNPMTGNVIVNTNSTYKFTRSENPDWYSLLPPKPSNFDEIRIMWERGIIKDIPEIMNESYWKQPEWFPRYNEGFVGNLQAIAASGREPIWSVDIFDAQTYRVINRDWLQNPTMPNSTGEGVLELKSDSVVLRNRFWTRASVGALRIFGVGIYPVYPDKTLILGSLRWNLEKREIQQDPEMVKKYIKVSAVETESGKTEYNLGTYWPKLSPDYQKQVWVITELKKDIPKGIYVVGVEAGSPSKEYQESQSLKYGLSYTDPNIGMFVNPGRFELFIEIV